MKNAVKKIMVFDSPVLSDALDACGIDGVLSRIKPLFPGCKLAGPAYTVQYQPYEERPETFQGAADYIDAVPAGSVICIDNQGMDQCTVWGNILTEVALLRHIAGTVVHGAVRDVSRIRDLRYPTFCCHITMRSGKNRVYKVAEQGPLNIDGVLVNPGDMLFADDHGVLVIPKARLDEVLEKAQTIVATEGRIITSVKAGSLLKEARRQHHYDTPWLNRGEP